MILCTNSARGSSMVSLTACYGMMGTDSWKRSELHSLSKQGKKEAKAEERDRKWKRFKRDEDRKCCGWSVRQVLVWGVFGAAIA